MSTGGLRRLTVGDVELAAGGVLRSVEVAYGTWGQLDAAGSNAVLVCHALTGSAHLASCDPAWGPEPGWWDGLVGSGRGLDPGRYFVVCPNLLGSCYGTTGPASTDPATGAAYGARFPLVTTRDMVAVQRRLLEHLGVRRLRLVIGGSLGGMLTWRWAVDHPDMVDAVMPIAGSLQGSPWLIALNTVARQAIFNDPAWGGGDYRDGGPRDGLALARRIAMISYRTDRLLAERFGRSEVAPDRRGPSQLFEVESYLHHHGAKLVERFDARAYVALTRAMDLHDVAHGFGSLGEALARVRSRVLAVGIDSDVLYLPHELRTAVGELQALGAPARYAELSSVYGHDAFLVEHEQLNALVRGFLEGRT